MMEKFKFPKLPEWATYCPGRSPEFKIHTTKGQASNAVSYHFPDASIKLLFFKDGDWEIIFEYEVLSHCQRCNHKFGTESWDGRNVSKGSPKWKQQVVCEICTLQDGLDEYLTGVVPYAPYGNRFRTWAIDALRQRGYTESQLAVIK